MGEFEGGDEAGLLVEAAEVADQIYYGILFLEDFAGCSLNCHQHVTRVYTSNLIDQYYAALHKSACTFCNISISPSSLLPCISNWCLFIGHFI